MADAASIKIVKTIPFRGGIKVWSNRYHFDDDAPTTSGRWTTLADNVVTAEKGIYNSYIALTEAVGYEAGSDVPVFSKAYASIVGTLGTSGDVQAPEVAALAKYTTSKRSSKNHPVYLFNYWHGAYCHSATEDDRLDTAQKDAMNAYIAAWIAGFSDGFLTHNRAGPDGSLALTGAVDIYVTHRDFRR